MGNIPSQWNFNSHPELTDEDFVYTALTVAQNGQAPTQASYTGWLAFLQQQGQTRWTWYAGQAPNSLAYHAGLAVDDAWFKIMPDWAPMAALLGGIGVFAIGFAVALYKRYNKNKGGGEY